jgi:hypothetical protein
MQAAKASLVPGLEQLERMPDMIATVIAGATDDEVRWKPAPARWSILEVLGHLAHVEAHGFRGRAQRILAEDNPLLENYDPDALVATGAYQQPNVVTALELYRRERERSVELLRTVQPEDLARPAVHGVLGAITLGNLLNEWPFHDLGHLRQITELTRTVRFYPHLGAWRQFYKLNP